MRDKALVGAILGVGGSKHDFAACLFLRGHIVVAIEEERLTRRKRGYGSDPNRMRCIVCCLDYAGLRPDQLDLVAANDLLPSHIHGSLGVPVQVYRHHLTHAASAYYPSGVREAAILVADHSGSRVRTAGRWSTETISYLHADGGKLELIGQVVGVDESRYDVTRDPRLVSGPTNSLGRLYALMAHACGCTTVMGDGKVHAEGGKLMGLSSYGDSRYYAHLRSFIELGSQGQIILSLGTGRDGLESWCQRCLAEARRKGKAAEFAAKASLAWGTQQVVEEALEHAARYLYDETGSANLCFAGGVALNAKANYRLLQRSGFKRLFVQPAAHDAGTALGAAYLAARSQDPGAPHRTTRPQSPYLGPAYHRKNIELLLAGSELSSVHLADPISPTAAILRNGGIVGVFRGRSEFGPRALGNRSILADPRSLTVKPRLDRSVKHREEYRPYAPVVRAEDADRFFAMAAPSPHMTLIGWVRPEWRTRLPAITHVDGTARVQTVTAEEHWLLHSLLCCFAGLTGIGVLLNTSMNVRGEPIVESPEDALRFLHATDVDALLLEDYLCFRSREHFEQIIVDCGIVIDAPSGQWVSC